MAFLKKRFETLTAHHCYRGMEFSNDAKQIAEWIPLVMEGRDPTESVAATHMRTGSDVDYGALTRILLGSLEGKEGFGLQFDTRVLGLRREGERWDVEIRNEKTGEHGNLQTKFVFIGAGGGSLPLLQRSGIPEAHGYAGFPVSGHLAPLRQPERGHAASGQGLRQGVGRLAADVGAAISTRATSRGRSRCSSDPMPVSRPSSSSTARISISLARSTRTIFCRCCGRPRQHRAD